MKNLKISFLFWVITSAITASVVSTVFWSTESDPQPFLIFAVTIGSFAASFPAFLLLLLLFLAISRSQKSVRQKWQQLALSLTGLGLMYGFAISTVRIFTIAGEPYNELIHLAISILIMLAIIAFATALLKNMITHYFALYTISSNTKSHIMQSTVIPGTAGERSGTGDKLLWKGLITAGLILLLMLPMVIISNLVTERQLRQQEVVNEVSSKWADAQQLSGPFLSIPYLEPAKDEKGNAVTLSTPMIIIPSAVNASAKLTTEQRDRSIYKVFLYRSQVNYSGNFKNQFQQGIKTDQLDWANAKLCFALSDFKGIDEVPQVNFNGQAISLDPGLPVSAFGKNGLSAPVHITKEMMDNGIEFTMALNLKGSSSLHFLPLASTAKFSMSSPWPNPSFDGNLLPGQRNVSDSGFTASWAFNKANLPYGMATKDGELKADNLGFGVSLVQPADQYNKTDRSVKYAILLIGLTFGLFFILEILQKNPVHPIQYGLVGVALIVFYTLLLSISEYLLFDKAYIIAALATILLISLYAKAHFHSWKTAGIFFAFLSMLYSFIFVLIRLEDTSLLVGSIGLFIIVALIMYASRKVNWYGNKKLAPAV